MLFIILQILLTKSQNNTNFLYLTNQPSLEIQVTLHSEINQPFILASSINQFENIFYVEGQDRIQSLNYDHESFITNNNVHIIFTQPSTTLFIYAGYINQTYNQYCNFTLKINDKPGNCSSYCTEQGNTCNAATRQCICQQGFFGQFCQLQRSIAVLQIQYDIVVKPLQWTFIGFETKQLNINESLKLKIKDQSSEMLMGLGMQGIQFHEIPNTHYDAYMIPKKIQQQIYQLKGDLIYYQSMCSNCSILNIGFYNSHSYPILFYFELFEREIIIEQDPYHLQVILQSICLLCFILSTYLIFRRIKQKQYNQQLLQAQRDQRRIRRRRRIQADQSVECLKGFNLDFIETYFPQFYYLDIIEKYPSLKEFIECVVCLESMAPPEQGKLTERDHIDHCSITPCYHLFHQHCLFKWLQTQKCCPLCRKEFKDNEIRNKPWISLNNDISIRQSSRCNPFIQRMKTRSDNTQQSDMPLIIETEQIETQPNKDIAILPQKSARDLIIK